MGVLGETPDKSATLELEQIGGWLRQGGVEDPQTMRDRIAGLRRYAEAMEDTPLLREIERVEGGG
jgi:hypothetical protein